MHHNWDIRKDKPLVTVLITTYNQAPYIRDCIEGALMQETDFPYEILIHDDASTDGTSDIVREYAARYPHVIRAIVRRRNQYSPKNSKRISRSQSLARVSRGEYFALCEGDDYWTDSKKLQKQADVLEAHPEYAASHSSVDVLHQTKGKLLRDAFASHNSHHTKDPEIQCWHIAADCFCIYTCTLMTRRGAMIRVRQKYAEDFKTMPMGDIPLFFHLARTEGYIFTFPESMAVYRVLPDSASRSSDIRKTSDIMLAFDQASLYLLKKYAPSEYLPGFVKRRCTGRYFLNLISRRYDNMQYYVNHCRLLGCLTWRDRIKCSRVCMAVGGFFLWHARRVKRFVWGRARMLNR